MTERNITDRRKEISELQSAAPFPSWKMCNKDNLLGTINTWFTSPAPLLSFVCRVELFSLNMLYFGHEIVD